MDTLKRIGMIIILTAAQVFVLGSIHLFGFATPLLYVYLALLFPIGYNKAAILIWCAAMGLIMDMFTNTPGIAMAAMTLIGFVQPVTARAFAGRDADEGMLPTMRTMGWGKYASYVVTLTLLFCIVFFSLEAFTFGNIVYWAKCVIGSTTLTVIFILTIESVRK